MTSQTTKARSLRAAINLLAADYRAAVEAGESPAELRCRKATIIDRERQLTELGQ